MAGPNVLFMIMDDHRYDAIRAIGDSVVETPTLDALAARGVSLRAAHCQGSMVPAVCVASRACLHTGSPLFHASSSIEPDDSQGAIRLSPAKDTFARTFRNAGWHTHAVGKWHNDKASFNDGFVSGDKLFFRGMSDHDKTPVFDYDPSGEYPKSKEYLADGFSTEVFCDAAIDFLQGYADDAPFFLYLALTSPHDPRMAPEPYGSMYEAERIPLPPNYLKEHPFDNGELTIRDEQLAAFPRDEGEVKQHIADYYAMITHHDHHLGRVLEALEQAGHGDDTILVYTSDHGLAVGRHGLMGKQNLYEHSVRIPCLVAGPDLPAGREVRGMTYLHDLYPTLCDLCEIDVPESVEGDSLAPLLTGATERGHEYVFGAYKEVQRMVKDDRHKLIRYYESDRRDAGTNRVQLFDLQADPYETQDLAHLPGHETKVDELARELAKWQGHMGDPLGERPVLAG